MNGKKKFIIEQPWGGLGDNLQFSTIPRILSEHGYEVFVSSRNRYRNPEIKDLVWGRNPHISGIDVDPMDLWSDGAVMVDCLKNLPDLKEGWKGSIVNRWEELITTSLIGEGKKSSGIPEVYYTPKEVDREDYIVVDLTATSTNGEYNLNEYLKIIEERRFCDIVVPKFSKLPDVEPIIPESCDEVVQVDSIYDYIDLISSSKYFYTSFAGANSLAPIYCSGRTTSFMPDRYIQKYPGRIKNEDGNGWLGDYCFEGVNYYAWWENTKETANGN